MSSSTSVASQHVYWVPKESTETIHEIDIKRSRFIAYANRVESVDESRELLDRIRRAHFDARHHCSALSIGSTREIQRSSDDGEPSGTAGVPMLDAITQRAMPDGNNTLSDVFVVVVRYFGGTLLGAGGLVRAYSEAVSRVLDEMPLNKRALVQKFSVLTTAADAGRLNFDLRNHGIEVLNTSYGADSVRIEVGVFHEPEAISRLHEVIASISSGSAQVDARESTWIDLGGNRSD